MTYVEEFRVRNISEAEQHRNMWGNEGTDAEWLVTAFIFFFFKGITNRNYRNQQPAGLKQEVLFTVS